VELKIFSNILTLNIEARDIVLDPDSFGSASQVRALEAATYSNCNSADIQRIETALAGAKTAVQKSRYYIGRIRQSGYQRGWGKFEKWFGPSSNKKTVDYVYWNYNLLFNFLQWRKPRFVCRPSWCGDSYWAWFKPMDETFTIYLCNLFFTTKFKEATIVHELTHSKKMKYPFPGTDDYTYKVSECQNLAKNQVWKARRNAANYEYFSENWIPNPT